MATPTPEPTARPASSPTPEPTPIPALDGRLAPISLKDSRSLPSVLSETELSCIGDDPEVLPRALTGQDQSSPGEQARLLACLEDETIDGLFLAGFVPSTDPLSLEASDCVREGFEVIEPRSVMMNAIEGDPGRAMAGSMAAMTVTIACLTDYESAAIEQMPVMRSEEREFLHCLMQELGGPGEMAVAVAASQAVHFATYKTAEEALTAAEEAAAILDAAAEACEMKLGTVTGQ